MRTKKKGSGENSDCSSYSHCEQELLCGCVVFGDRARRRTRRVGFQNVKLSKSLLPLTVSCEQSQ